MGLGMPYSIISLSLRPISLLVRGGGGVGECYHSVVKQDSSLPTFQRHRREPWPVYFLVE